MPTTHLLARAVIRARGHVLLVRADGRSHTFLPGGHVEPHEGLVDCLHREMREELAVDISVGSYLGVVEHSWSRDGAAQYELNHCFGVTVPALNPGRRPRAREKYLTFGWVPQRRGALRDADLQPAPLRRLLVRSEASADGWWASTLESSTPAGAEGGLEEGAPFSSDA